MPRRTDDAYPAAPLRPSQNREILIAEHLLDESSVTSGKVADAAIIEAKLATDAVVTAKIKDSNVTLAKLDSSLRPGSPAVSEQAPPVTDIETTAAYTDIGTVGLTLSRGLKVLLNVSGSARIKAAGSQGKGLMRVVCIRDSNGATLDTSAEFPFFVNDTTNAWHFSFNCLLNPRVSEAVTFKLQWKSTTGGQFRVSTSDFASMVVTQL